MTSKSKRERTQLVNDVSTAEPLPSVLDFEGFGVVKKERIVLSIDDYNNLYFVPSNSDLFVQRKIVADRFMPTKKLEKDVMCVRSIDIRGKLNILQIWDVCDGAHAKFLSELLRFVSDCYRSLN